MRYTFSVILTFQDDDTRELFLKGTNRRWKHIESVVKRKLDMIEAAKVLSDLKSPPRNYLEALKGSRKGQHSIRIDDPYRVCFTWKEDGGHNVGITDYH